MFSQILNKIMLSLELEPQINCQQLPRTRISDSQLPCGIENCQKVYFFAQLEGKTKHERVPESNALLLTQNTRLEGTEVEKVTLSWPKITLFHGSRVYGGHVEGLTGLSEVVER